MITFNSPLEKIEPTKCATLLLIYFKILCIIALIAEVVISWDTLERAIRRDDAEAFLMSIFVLVLMVVGTLIIYYIVTRLTIAPLMTWHFTRENTMATLRLLEHFETKEDAKKVIPEVPATPEAATPNL